MAFQNHITLLGNIGKAPETKVLPGGTELVTFSLAVSMPTKDGDTWGYVTEWHNCKAFGRVAERIGKMEKGTKIGIIGEQRIETWEKDGERQYRHVVNVQQVQVIIKPIQDAQPATNRTASNGWDGIPAAMYPPKHADTEVFPGHTVPVSDAGGDDDDLPF
jgi:single-strand DNA-binding protein